MATQQRLREQWLRAPTRVIVAYAGSDGGEDGDTIVYAKESLPDGWNTWALMRSRRHAGGVRQVTTAYRRRNGRLRFDGDLHDDVLTLRIFAALKNGIVAGAPLELTAQVDLEEWLVLFGGEE